MNIRIQPSIKQELKLINTVVVLTVSAVIIGLTLFILFNSKSEESLAQTQTETTIQGTGPGGIGNSKSNGLWLRADAINQENGSAVTNWIDKSYYKNDGAQTDTSKRPKYYSTSDLNSMPVIRFDGINDEIAIADASVLDSSAGLTYYAVIRPKNLDKKPRGVLGKRITYSTTSNYSYTWFFHSNDRLYLDLVTSNNRFHSGNKVYQNNSNYILSFDFDGTVASNKRATMYDGSEAIIQSNESSNFIPAGNQDLILGALNTNYGTYLGADYAEVIQFNYSLDSLEHIIVQNYLSAKYNIPLNTKDLYTQDDYSNGDYDFDVAGIGKISDNVTHDYSTGSGIVTISNPQHLDNNEFLFWGHDGSTLLATNTDDVPTEVDARFDRVWRVNEVDGSSDSVDVGNIDITWNLSDLGTIRAEDLVLLVDTDNDGLFNDEETISGAIMIDEGSFRFESIASITNNSRFTLGTTDVGETALPVDLIRFTATSSNNDALLQWATATELNNSHFSIERSFDGNSFEHIDQVFGNGNSASVIEYEYLDKNILRSHQTVFYRLKQVDFDSKFEYSPIVYLKSQNENMATVYPNPAVDFINISKQGCSFSVKIINQSGVIVQAKYNISDNTQFSVKQLPTGLYVVQILSEDGDETHKILVKK